MCVQAEQQNLPAAFCARKSADERAVRQQEQQGSRGESQTGGQDRHPPRMKAGSVSIERNNQGMMRQ